MSPEEDIRSKFVGWLQPRPIDRYALYRHFLSGVSDRDCFWSDLAAKSANLPRGKRETIHYLFMAAVQYLALKNSTEPIAAYFPASPELNPVLDHRNTTPVFIDFVERNHTDLWKIIEARDVQINKLGRLALFAPFFLKISSSTRAPLAFVDVGCSIGLGLLWPNFTYRYGAFGTISSQASMGELSCAAAGASQPPVPLHGRLGRPDLLFGIEISPLSFTSAADRQWLLALTAPGDDEGRRALSIGIDTLAAIAPRIESGCVLDVLPRIERTWERDVSMVTYHSMTMHHLRTADGRDKEKEFVRLLADISVRRTVFDVGVEWGSSRSSQSVLPKPVIVQWVQWESGHRQVLVTAETDPSADGNILRFS